MCGINGFSFKNPKLIQQMNKALAHRGPDDEGVYTDQNISSGSRRLAILDLSKKGHMPMSAYRGKLWITYNGEIYNYKSIRNTLTKLGYKFKSNTDTEVILKGYQHFGDKIFTKLDGMFAIAIWDKSKQELVLARDRVGIKPLYYSLKDGQLIFSSEIKAITNSHLKSSLDLTSFNLYFHLHYTPAPRTLFTGISKLKPGHTLIWKNQKIKLKKYWHPPSPHKQFSHHQLVQKLDRAITTSVKENLISDRPVGVFLSGGIDSSLILAHTRKNYHDTLHTYTAGFLVSSEQDKYNHDLRLAKFTSNHFSTQHHQVMVCAKDVIDNFSATTHHLDEPIANLNQTAIYLLSKKARENVTVVLSGDGGDELFAGYQRYMLLYYLQYYQKIPQSIRGQLENLAAIISPKHSQLLNKASLSPPGLQRQLRGQDITLLQKVVSPDLYQPHTDLNFFAQHILSNQLLAREITYSDFSTWLAEESLLKSDKLTMANSIEQRVPLLTNRIVNIGLSTPFYQKITPLQTKILLREVAKLHLPQEIYSAPKTGFSTPIAKWLRNELKDFSADWLTISDTKHIFNHKQVKKLFQDHQKGAYHPHLLWSIITFNYWYHTFIKSNHQT